MYEAVYPYPVGDATVSRFAATLDRAGYDGMVARSVTSADDPVGAPDAPEDFDVVDAVEVVASDPSSAAGAVGSRRPETTLLILRGGTPELNRFAAEEPKVDVLSAPMEADGDVNHVVAKAAREHGVRVEFDLAPVLRKTGGPRIRALRGLRKLRELVEQYDTPYVVSARPRSHLHVRAPRELLALGEEIGFSREQIRRGLREWGVLAERNRDRLNDDYIAPGVRRGRYDPDDWD